MKNTPRAIATANLLTLFAFAAICYLTACTTEPSGNETLPVARAIDRAREATAGAHNATASARSDNKRIKALTGQIGEDLTDSIMLGRRIDNKAIRALRKLNP